MHQKTILVIDDSKLQQGFVSRALARGDFEIVPAYSGLEALNALSKRRFDVVLMELTLPDISGLSVARTIRAMKNCEKLPICIIAAELPQGIEAELADLEISRVHQKGSLQAQDMIDLVNLAHESGIFKRDIDVLAIECPLDLRHQILRLRKSIGVNVHHLDSRTELANHVVSTVPNVLLFVSHSTELGDVEWMLRYYQDGLLQGLPWVLAFSQGIPSDLERIVNDRAILPLAVPCSDIQLEKTLELVAALHQTRTSSEENSLELEIAYAEMEKNRLALTEAKSELSHRRTSFGTILSKIGVEIREPLTAILGFAEALKSVDPASPAHGEALETMRNSGKCLAQVVDDILGIAAIERGLFTVQKKDFDLLGLIGEVALEMQQRAHGAGINFAVAFDSEVPLSINSDPTILQQILHGLLDNAIKFTLSGTVRLRITFDRTFNQLSLAVSDTGPGIPPEQLATLFASFTGSSGSQPQLHNGGLGLWFVKVAAERLGGDLQLSSRVGTGSTFTLVLDPGKVTEVIGPEFAHTVLDLGKDAPRINPEEIYGQALVYGYLPDNQRLLSFLLKQTSMSCAFAQDPAQLIELALDDACNVLLLDVLTPDVDGFSLVRGLRQRGFAKPIVAISACLLEEQRQRCLDVGCNVVLDKPFNVAKLYGVLANLLAGEGFNYSGAGAELPGMPTPADLKPDPQRDEMEPDTQVLLQPLINDFYARTEAMLFALDKNIREENWLLLRELALDLFDTCTTCGLERIVPAAEALIHAVDEKDRASALIAYELLHGCLTNSDAVQDSAEWGIPQDLEQFDAPPASAAAFPQLKSALHALHEALNSDEWIEANEIASELAQADAVHGFWELEPLLQQLCAMCQGCNKSAALALIDVISEQIGPVPADQSEPAAEAAPAQSSFADVIDELERLLVEMPTGAFPQQDPDQESASDLDDMDLLYDDTEPAQVDEIDVLLEKLSAETMLDLPSSADLPSSLSLLQPRRQNVELRDPTPPKPLEVTGEHVPAPEPAPETEREERETDAMQSSLLKEEPSIAPLVLDFLDELKVLMNNMQVAFAERDWREFGYIAQEISGSAGICGYQACADAARNLQQAASSKRAESVETHLPELQKICAKMFRGRKALQKFSEQLQ